MTRIKYVAVLVCLIAAAFSTQAQAHSVKLSWIASVDTANTNVYRNAGACPTGAPTGFSKLTASPVITTTFNDSSPVVGLSCYYVTAFANGLESGPGNLVQVSLPPASPTNLQVTSVAANVPQGQGQALKAEGH